MSGHSKWSTIKRKKGAKDAARSKVWGKLIREVAIAAREGGDPESNSRLRLAVDKSRTANMPNDTIEKAIKRGTGELEGVVYEETSYEGYGPGGVAILVEVQTDNRNRTTAEVRHVFTKFNGKLGANGCVSYLFDRRGMIIFDAARTDIEAVMDAAIEAGADDVEEEDDNIVVMTEMADLHSVTQALEKGGFPVVSSELTLVPQTTVKVENSDVGSLMRLINELDDLDDVSNVAANFDIDDEALAQLEDQI